MLRAGAGWAQAEDVNDVVRLRVAMLCGNVFGPLFYGIRLYFNSRATFSADEVVVVRVWGARPKQTLTVLLQRVGVTGSGEVGERAIDGREPDGATGVAERTVQGLSAHETL